MLSDGSGQTDFVTSRMRCRATTRSWLRDGWVKPTTSAWRRPRSAWRKLADLVAALGRELFGYSGKIVRQQSADKDYLVDNPSRRCPVITKARPELGYDPQMTIEEGLRRSLIWYSGNREASEA